jgi:hypothetical protein
MMYPANTTKSTGSTGSTGSERVKPAEFIAFRRGASGTPRLRATGSTGFRLDFVAISAGALHGLRELLARAAA